MFCARRFIFGVIEGVRSRFNVLRSHTHFRRNRGRRITLSHFAPSSNLSAVPCAPEHIFGGIEGVGSHFHVLSSHNSFWRNRASRVPFSCFTLPDSFRRYRGRLVQVSCFLLSDRFSAEPRASGPVFMFCSLGLIFIGT
jgi:hypothetical protein